MTRLRLVKGVLWFLVGLAATVAFFRFFRGLGAVTALSDWTPWGLWISFDVFGGVALAAGGFVIAATVYIFHLERYRPILRPAILTAFLGYVAVVVGLIFDLGIPWNIWRPVFFWQHHSALFEVAWCVILYLTVLALEFAPVVLERFQAGFLRSIYRVLKKLTLPLVILGIMLSTLHQSSLGTLFMVMPFRLHPLWYSGIQPVLFFVSAVGLGLTMVMTESIVSSWLYGKELEKDILAGLAKAASFVLLLYAVIRIGDLAAGDKLHYLTAGTWESNLFVFEMLVSAILPALIFAVPAARRSRGGLAAGAGLAVFGFVLNRISVSGLSHIFTTATDYFPTWMEFSVSIGIVSVMVLAFLFFVENFYVYHEPRKVAAGEFELPPADPVSGARRQWAGLADAGVYALLFIIGLSLVFGLVPDYLFKGGGDPLKRAPVDQVRQVEGLRIKPDGQPVCELALGAAKRAGKAAGGAVREVLLLDGARNDKFVLFDHEMHKEKNGGKESCGLCHHMNMPLDRVSSCNECHRDMFLTTDIFDHSLHAEKMEGKGDCASCHATPAWPKNRDTAKACSACHKNMAAPGSRVKLAKKGWKGLAPGYMDAMHKLCIECHKEKEKQKPELAPHLARCGACHQGLEGSMLTALEPYPGKAP